MSGWENELVGVYGIQSKPAGSRVPQSLSRKEHLQTCLRQEIFDSGCVYPEFDRKIKHTSARGTVKKEEIGSRQRHVRPHRTEEHLQVEENRNTRPDPLCLPVHVQSVALQRPPLAALTTNKLPSNQWRSSGVSGPRPITRSALSLEKSRRHVNTSPRKLLWPTNPSQNSRERVRYPQPRLQSRQLSSQQSPLSKTRYRQAKKELHNREVPRIPVPYITDYQKRRITEREQLSVDEQKFHLQNRARPRQRLLSSPINIRSLARGETIASIKEEAQYVPFEEKQPSLVERFVQRLPDSPPTLHIHDSRQPPNPGSPRAASPFDRFQSVTKSNTITSSLANKTEEGKTSPSLMRKLLRWEIWLYRIVLGTSIVALNISMLLIYLFTPRHQYLLVFLVFMKSKDMLSTLAGILGLLWYAIRDRIWKPKDVNSKWIVSIVCGYAETEAQIIKTTTSLIDQELVQHKQVICIILDGKPRNVLSHFSRVTHMMERSYTTWKGVQGLLQIHAGLIRGTPVLLIQKARNAGKKDTLVLGHSLFNYPRDDCPLDIKLIRRDIFAHVLPQLTGMECFKSFDCVYATDADSNIHKDCLKHLANALGRNPKAIAACGIILAELDEGSEWTAWHLFQQFQYTFGQYVRRSAETVWGRVTCLPGPVTMMTVRPEMGSAISEYAAPITSPNLFLHQVQYQGTDRRLTWCMLSQNKDLQTILVTEAIGETVVPSSLDHYLSQRRRWAANAYFNDYMYTFGKNQHLITRLFGLIDIIRMSFVYYRVMNTALFLRSLVRIFYVSKVLPTLILTKSPTAWFLLLMLMKEPVLRKRLHKLACGIALNQFMSPLLSVIVFSRVLLNMGNHAWGKTGVSSRDAIAVMVPTVYPESTTPRTPWSPRRLIDVIRNAIQPPFPPGEHPALAERQDVSDSEESSYTLSTESSLSTAHENSENLAKSFSLAFRNAKVGEKRTKHSKALPCGSDTANTTEDKTRRTPGDTGTGRINKHTPASAPVGRSSNTDEDYDAGCIIRRRVRRLTIATSSPHVKKPDWT